MNAVGRYMRTLEVDQVLREEMQRLEGYRELPTESQERWQSNLREQERLRNEEIHPDPQLALELLWKLLDRPGETNSHGRLLDYVPTESLPTIFQRCLPALGTTYKEADALDIRLAHEYLRRLVHQAPHLFHPHLEILWSKNKTDYTEAWQDSGTKHHEALFACLADPKQQKWHWVAQVCLERSNCVEAFEWLRLNRGHKILEEAGVEYRDGEWCRLYPEHGYHICLPTNVLEDHNRKAPEHMQLDDLSWRIGGKSIPARFWGEETSECPECETGLQHLLTLTQPIPVISAMPPLKFVICPMCAIGERPTYFKHDELGTPILWPSLEVPNNPYDISSQGIEVELRPTPPRWYRQHPFNDNQNINRVGGPPSWLQGPEHIWCPQCNQMMQFLFQIGDGFVYANGMIYGFWCEPCRMSALLNTYT